MDREIDMDERRALVDTVMNSIKCWEILEQLHNWRLLMKYSSPWS
jgi:hypothetical protein